MKNCNRRSSSHGHHGSMCHKLAQHAHSRGSHAFTCTPTSTHFQPRCAKRQLSYYRIWIWILLLSERTGRRRATSRSQPRSLKGSQLCILPLDCFRADRTQTGHILGPAAQRGPESVPERQLSAVECALLRFLTHAALYLAANNPAQVFSIIIIILLKAYR